MSLLRGWLIDCLKPGTSSPAAEPDLAKPLSAREPL